MERGPNHTNASRREVLGGAAILAMSAAAAQAAVPTDRGRLIAVEEAYASQTWADAFFKLQNIGAELPEFQYMQSVMSVPIMRRQLFDIDERLRIMDATGIAMHVLSLTVPGVQMFAPADAIAMSRDVNDELAATIAAHPGRFAGLGVAAPQAPEAAAQEIQRAMGKLKLNGIIINSHTHGEYLDDPKFAPLLEAAEETGAALYLHPRLPAPAMFQPYAAWGLRGPILGFAAEAGLHAMRLVMSGTFDRFPRLKIVLGHMGEALPFWFYRMDNMYAKMSRNASSLNMAKLQLKPSEYIRRNITISTSGMNDPDVLSFCIKKMGVENVMFAIDYPYEDSAESAAFINAALLNERDRKLVTHANAERVFGIKAA